MKLQLLDSLQNCEERASYGFLELHERFARADHIFSNFLTLEPDLEHIFIFSDKIKNWENFR